MKVHRFQILIETAIADGYAVHVLSPRGETRASFAPPLTPAEVETFSDPSRDDRDLGTGREGTAPWSPVDSGKRLSEVLFQDEVLRLYERSLDLLERDPEARLRLEIVLDPRDPRLARLQRLPWELLRQPGTPEALALSRRRPLVRYLSVPRPIHAARRPATLRILAVGADPRASGLPPLDLARELRHLREAVGSAPGGVALEIVQPDAPTLAGLRRALLDQECHVLHFMGHGGRVLERDEWVLFFENEAGGAEPVRGTDLMNKLADFSSLRLVVLNACRSAAAPGEDPVAGFDPFAGVATSLVLGGLPAVVAMRSPISDGTAIAFSRVFYRRLAAGDPADIAVVEGRQAVHSIAPAGFEWATPVLFMRTPSGELYPEVDILPESPRRSSWLRRFAAALLVLSLAAAAWFGGRAWWGRHLAAEGAAFARHGQWEEARKKLLKAVKLAPLSAEVQADFARVEEHAGFLDTAEKSYRRALRLEPQSAGYRHSLGRVLNRQGEYRDAYKILQSAVELSPESADVRGELASAAMALGLLDEARAALTAALRLAPASPTVHRLWGELELTSDRPAAAVGHLDAALRRYPVGDPDRVRTVSLLVQAYDRSGDQPATCREARELRHLDAQASTPWARQAEEIATRRGCLPGRE
jgi:Tfp pilus assembly protein PilF